MTEQAGLRTDATYLKAAAARLRTNGLLGEESELSARLLEAIADQVEFAADASGGLACDVEVRPTWVAALTLARTILGGES